MSALRSSSGRGACATCICALALTPLVASLALFTGTARGADPVEVAKRRSRLVQLEEAIVELRLELDGLRPKERLVALEAKLAALEARLAELQRDGVGSVDERLSALELALEEVRGDLVTSADLKRYQLKPNDKEFRSRSTQELEVRVAMQAYRHEVIEHRLEAIDDLVLDEDLRPTIEALGRVGALLLANDQDVRARTAFRFYWEANRFLADNDLLFVYAMPEIMVFAQRHDIDRYQLDRDFTEPRDRFALRLKKAALGAQLGSVRLVAGVLQLTYGAGFFINPTNPFTPKHVLDPRREVDGIPAAQLEWTPVADDGLTLSLQLTAVSTPVRNDVSGDRWDELAYGGFAKLKLDTDVGSLMLMALYQEPDAIGRDAPSFGGTLSLAPFGVTTSCEALLHEDGRGVMRPEIVTSLQGFFADLGANGTTWVLEYYYNGHALRSEDALLDEVRWAIEREHNLYAADLLLRPLARRHYLNLYLEPSLSTDVQANVAALIGLEHGGGVLARAGLDWEIASFVVHTYGGLTWGAEGSELRRHVLESFVEVAITAGF